MGEEAYRSTMEGMAATCLAFLREMEEVQETLSFFQIESDQERIATKYQNPLESMEKRLEELSPPSLLVGLHGQFSRATSHLLEGWRQFSYASGERRMLQILEGLHQLSLSQYLLYDLRRELPPLEGYWVLDENLHHLPELEAPVAGHGRPTGFVHRSPEGGKGGYSLYVPEGYDTARSWPLIICLHGGMGRGDDYIWTWLRLGKSRGYLLLSPKSILSTWSLMGEDLDEESVLAMLEEVREEYRIDERRIFLTGLSDGGSYTFTLGLKHPELFAGLAPVAGVLQVAGDPQRARGLSILMIHGQRDYIFPVGMARSAYAYLVKNRFQVIYRELEDWGHAFPYRINERIILPWFEELARNA